MKKLLLSLLVGASTVAFAQKNISLTLISPAENAIVEKQTAFNVQMTVKNEGSVAVTTQDTILIGFFLNNNILNGPNGPLILRVIPTADIAPGASNNYSLNGLSLSFNQAGTATFCAVAALRGDTGTTGNDNADCNNITLAFRTGLNEENQLAQSLKVYPNPAKDVLNISIDTKETVMMNIFDITGKLVETVNVENGNAQVDVRNYNNGVYLYQLNNTEGKSIKTGKFTVTNN